MPLQPPRKGGLGQSKRVKEIREKGKGESQKGRTKAPHRDTFTFILLPLT